MTNPANCPLIDPISMTFPPFQLQNRSSLQSSSAEYYRRHQSHRGVGTKVSLRTVEKLTNIVAIVYSKLTFSTKKTLLAKTSGKMNILTAQPHVSNLSERSCHRATNVKTKAVDHRAFFEPPKGT